MPSSCYEWLKYHIPISGELEDGRKYYKHGYGCRVYLNSKGVDFDFGEQGEVGGFNSWGLTEFAGSNLSSYGFRNYEEVNEHLKSALDNGQIAPLNNNLYYLQIFLLCMHQIQTAGILMICYLVAIETAY